MIVRKIWVLCCFLMLLGAHTFAGSASPTFQLQLELAHTPSHCQVSESDCDIIPLQGPYYIQLDVLNDNNQSIMQDGFVSTINAGVINLDVQDPSLDWSSYLMENTGQLRVGVRERIEDPFMYVFIPLKEVPFSVVSQVSKRAKQFKDDTLIHLDYDTKKLSIHGSNYNAKVAVKGNVEADYFVGDASGLSYLTGEGLNDGYSLNAPNGVHKDIVFVDSQRNLGVHTLHPKAQLHVRGDAMFRGVVGMDSILDHIPSGSVFLWEPVTSSFISGKNKFPIKPNLFGQYVIGFGSDIHLFMKASVVLGGQGHVMGNIDNLESNQFKRSSVILGGQRHVLGDSYSVIGGGVSHALQGEYSVVLGGVGHDIMGDYNVVLGGEGHVITSNYSTVLGEGHVLNSNDMLVVGQSHQSHSGADSSVVLGKNVIVKHPDTFVYSDGDVPVTTTAPGQILVYSKHGVGVNKIPDKYSQIILDVNKNIKATTFIGDGRFITNIIPGQHYWRRNNDGLYFNLGRIYIGDPSTYTSGPDAKVVVNGGIQIGESADKSNALPGTLHYVPSTHKLEFLRGINDWVKVNAENFDTKLRMGTGLAMFGNAITLADFDANIGQYLGVGFGNVFKNTWKWQGVTSEFWLDGSDAIHTDKFFNLSEDGNQDLQYPLVVQDVVNTQNVGTTTMYPLVIGSKQRLALNPKDASIIFKQFSQDSLAKEGQFSVTNNGDILFSVDSPLMRISSTGVAVGDAVSNVALDTGHLHRIRFPHTYINYDALDEQERMGVGLRNGFQYLFLRDDDLVLRSNKDDSIGFYVTNNGVGSLAAQVVTSNQFVLGSSEARATLTIPNGYLGLHVDSSTIGSDSGAYIKSIQEHSAIQFVDRADNVVMDISQNKVAVGAHNTGLAVGETLFYSNQKPSMILESGPGYASRLSLQNSNSLAHLLYDDSVFSLNFGSSSGSLQRYMAFGALYSPDSMVFVGPNSVVFNEWVGVERLLFSGDNNIGATLSGDTDLVLSSHQYPIQFSIQGSPHIVVSQNGHIVIGGNHIHDAHTVVVPKDMVFSTPPFYGTDTSKTLDAFHLHSGADIHSDVDSLVVDTATGIDLDHTTTSNYVTFIGPNVFRTFFASANTTLSSVPNQALEFKEGVGVSINILDSNADNVLDTVQFVNPLFSNGGDINGGLYVQGTLNTDAIVASGVDLLDSHIPWQWLKNDQGIYYIAGNVGIGIATPRSDLDVMGTMRSTILIAQTVVKTPEVYIDQNTSNTWSAADDVIFNYGVTDSGLNVSKFSFNQDTNPLFKIGNAGVRLFSSSLDSASFFINNTDLYRDLLIFSKSNHASLQFQHASGAYAYVGDTGDASYIQSNRPVRLQGKAAASFISIDSNQIVFNPKDSNMYIGDNSIDVPDKVLMVQGALRVGDTSDSNHTSATVYAKNGLTAGLTSSVSKRVYIHDKVVIGSPGKTNYKLNTSLASMPSFQVLRGSNMVGSVSQSIIHSTSKKVLLEGSSSVNINDSLKVGTDGVRFGSGAPVSNVDVVVSAANDTSANILLDGTSNSQLTLRSTSTTSHISLTDNALRIQSDHSGGQSEVHVGASGVGINIVPKNSVSLTVTPSIKANTLLKNGQRLYPMPIGAIVMWTNPTIPDGWALCDGSEHTDKYGNKKHTPDLRDRFIMAVKSVASANSVGGEKEWTSVNDTDNTGVHEHVGGIHEHTVLGNSHDHHSVTVTHNNTTYSSGTYDHSTETVDYVHYAPDSGDDVYTAKNNHAHDYSLQGQEHEQGQKHEYQVGASSSHNHTGNTYFNDGDGLSRLKSGGHSHKGGAHDHTLNNEPAYYTLAFIIKIY